MKKIKFFIGILISTLIVVYLYINTNWKEIFDLTSNANFWVLIPATFIIVAQFVFRSLRWNYLINKNNTSLRLKFDAILFGNFINYILPMRAGEFVRPGFLSSSSKLTYSHCLISVILERFFDLMAVLAGFIFIVFSNHTFEDYIYRTSYFFSLLVLSIFVFIFLSIFYSNFLKKIVNLFIFFLPISFKKFINNFLDSFIESALILNNKKNLFFVVFYTILVWLTTYLQFYIFLFLFDLGTIPISATFAVLIATLVALAVAAPSAPGFIGVFQAGCLLAFSLFGIDKSFALSYSLIVHLHQYILILLYGVYIIFRYSNKIDLKSLFKFKK